MTLILGSKSPYRKALLEQAGFQFIAHTSPFDEDAFKRANPSLSPKDLCLQLAEGKAKALRSLFPQDLIVGSDQLIEWRGQVLDKPGNHQRAFEQLSLLSGQTHFVHTSLVMIAPNEVPFKSLRTIEVQLKPLNKEDIEFYLQLDTPYDCAGSYKMERAGLMLTDRMEGGDPSAIQGLSMIDLFSGLKYLRRSPYEFIKLPAEAKTS